MRHAHHCTYMLRVLAAMCSRLVTSFSPLGFESFHSTYVLHTYLHIMYVYYCFMHEPASPQRVVQRITSITKQGEGRTKLSLALFSLLPFGKCICNPPAKLMKSYVRFNFRRYLMLIICNMYPRTIHLLRNMMNDNRKKA